MGKHTLLVTLDAMNVREEEAMQRFSPTSVVDMKSINKEGVLFSVPAGDYYVDMTGVDFSEVFLPVEQETRRAS